MSKWRKGGFWLDSNYGDHQANFHNNFSPNPWKENRILAMPQLQEMRILSVSKL